MSVPRRYLAEIGRRGGMKSRRHLDPGTARQMVRIREARRAARHARHANAQRRDGTPADTSVAAQSIQDALWRRVSPADKLRQVARLARMVEQLWREGIRRRHPADDEDMMRYRRAEMRLGRELAARVYDTRRETT